MVVKSLDNSVVGQADVAIIGGGAIGLSVAYHAARRGAKVVLFEAAELGLGASGALAGMLSGQGEAEKPGPLQDLLVRGREYHRAFGPELCEDTGLDPGYIWDGALRTATDEVSAEKLAEEHSWHEETNFPSEKLSGNEARELEPALARGVVAGLYLPDDGNVNPPELVRALAQGATNHGAKLWEYEGVAGFLTQGGRVTGVKTARGAVSAGSVVLAGGVMSGLLAEQLGVRLPLYSMKGQLLETRISPVPIRANLWDHGNFYVVPKRDGRVIVGATEETNIRDRRPTLGGISELLGNALNLVPSLEGALFLRAWGGLRPATPTGAPILGPVAGLDGLVLATGHHRNGVLLSAITGEIVSALALGEPPPVDISSFVYDKLDASSRAPAST